MNLYSPANKCLPSQEEIMSASVPDEKSLIHSLPQYSLRVTVCVTMLGANTPSSPTKSHSLGAER